MFEEKISAPYHHISEKGVELVQGWVIGESRWTLFVNDSELVTFMATSRNLHYLALGFLASENFITRLDEVASLRVNLAPDCAYWYLPALGIEETRAMAICEQGVGSIQVRLTRAEFRLPARRIITSGCGGGVTFDDLSKEQTPIASTRTVRVSELFAMMRELNAQATLYRECRGVHTSALGNGAHLVAFAEDVGRHNTLDKLRGECLLHGIATQDQILISTGRISSEMLTKAAKMRVPIVVSRTSPTSLSLQLARAWNITLVGYLHAGQMQVYTGIERIQTDDQGRRTQV